MVSIAQSLQQATKDLQAVSDSARLDAELFLCAVLNCDRLMFYREPEAELTASQQAGFRQLLDRRMTREPVAYITGKKDFWTLSLAVDASTLIPRPDTETLVQWALDTCQHQSAKVVDLGTGTGAIALALATGRPAWTVHAVDQCANALAMAERNRDAMGIRNVSLFHGNWFDALPAGAYDMVVSNPPYIAPDDEHLVQGELQFEPRGALVSAQQGYADLYHIIESAKNSLTVGGWLLLEHGYSQADQVRCHMMACGYRQVTSRHDVGGHERVTTGQWCGEDHCHAE